MTNNSIYLAQQLGEQLQQLGWSVTCAESCTGGGIGYAITSTSGSSSWFKSGYITYSNEAKQSMLGGSAEKPVGTVWFGFAINGDVSTSCQCFSGDRHEVRSKVIEYALSQLSSLLN